MKKKLLICLVVLGLTSGCGKVTTLPNGDEALVSFTNENLGISAGDLYNKIKNTALSSLLDMIDTKILLDKYPDKESDANKYVDEQYDLIKNNYKDDNGKKHKIRNLCPHMKCSLIFNFMDKTWDCPCHGSRFDIDGNVIKGPSVLNIKIDDYNNKL